MKTLAAILTQTGKLLELDEIDIPHLQSGQVLVKVNYSGVCGTQLSEVDGKKGEDKWLPHCIGHEAIGSVVDIGRDVTRFRKHDNVVMSWLKTDGIDAGGTQYSWGGRKVNAGPVTTFQHYAVVSENRLTKMVSNSLGEMLVLLGCAAPTGMGAVKNVLRPHAGESIIIFGAGGVGLCALMMARKMNMSPIIVSDISEQRLSLAKQFGADITVNVNETQLHMAMQEHDLQHVDYLVEATGNINVVNSIMELLRPQGGRAVIVGNAPVGQIMKISPSQFNMGKSILGTWGGDSKPERDFDIFLQILNENKDVIRKMNQTSFSLEQVNEALACMRSRTVARPILAM